MIQGLIQDLADPDTTFHVLGDADKQREMACVRQDLITALENTARRYEQDHPDG
jgi:hypothetical protein